MWLLLALLAATNALQTPAPRTRSASPKLVAIQKPASALAPAWPPRSMELLPESASRAALPIGGSAVALALALPQTPEYWNIGSATMPMVPITTMGVMFAIVMLAWTAFGTEMHPITAKARGVEPPPGNTFQVLGLTGPIFASAALAFGMHALPVAGTSIEAMHCLLPFALWYVDVALLKWLNPHVEWPEEATSLSANYKAEHATPVSAALQLLGVFMFEVRTAITRDAAAFGAASFVRLTCLKYSQPRRPHVSLTHPLILTFCRCTSSKCSAPA